MKRGKGRDRVLGDHVVKLTHQTLIRPENNRADCFVVPVSFFAARWKRARALPKADAQPKFNSALVIGQSANGSFELSDARCSQGLHCPDDGLEIVGTLDLSLQAFRRIAHDVAVPSFAALN
ncbi:hypothetical protein GCM10011371_28530 [Novosphingobium marinum]|nr:hypothetical protein GCM10011371_28530 [Novosphingobium marinum]